MDRNEFDAVIGLLKINYKGFTLTTEKADMWFNAVKIFDRKQIMDNMKKHIETSRDYPMLADLRKGLNRQDGWVDQWKILNSDLGIKYLDDTAQKVHSIMGVKHIESKLELSRKWRDFERLYKELSPSGNRKFIDFETLGQAEPEEQNEEEEEAIDMWNV